MSRLLVTSHANISLWRGAGGEWSVALLTGLLLCKCYFAGLLGDSGALLAILVCISLTISQGEFFSHLFAYDLYFISF